jgi:hypothetical protein
LKTPQLPTILEEVGKLIFFTLKEKRDWNILQLHMKKKLEPNQLLTAI